MDTPDHISPPVGGSSYLDPLQQQTQGQAGVEHERSPIRNSPWKESSLDQPYQKAPKPQSACSSRSRYTTGQTQPVMETHMEIENLIIIIEVSLIFNDAGMQNTES